LKLDAGLDGARKRVIAVNHLFSDEVAKLDDTQAPVHSTKSVHLIGTRRAAQRDFFQGNGFYTSIQKIADFVMGVIGPPNVQFRTPHDNFINALWPEMKEAVLARLMPETRAKFTAVMSHCPLGIVAIVGFAGAGKTETTAIAAACFMANPQVRTIYCSAASNVATDNFAARLHRISAALHVSVPDFSAPMVVRGYRLHTEMRTFLSILNGQPTRSQICRGSPWKMHLSVCEWTLRLIGFNGYDLSSVTNEKVLELAAEFRFNREYESLRRLARGEATLTSIVRASCMDPDKEERGLRTQLEILMERIIACADAVCTTPYASDEGFYKHFKCRLANGVVLDEAGCMTKSDALIVWRDGMPCIMAGDPRQLPPSVMTNDEEHINPFSREARVSVLEHYEKVGFPTLTLDEQLRIVCGGFDMVHSLIYPDLSNFSYGDRARLENHGQAAEVDRWISKTFGIMESPAGKIYPTFLHIPGTCKQDGTSRYNEDQNDVVRRAIHRMTRETSIKPEQIAIATPYKSNQRRLKRLLKGSGVDVTTTDSYQGQENQVIFFVTVAQGYGTPFIGSPNRLCVALSRHVGTLIVVGDRRVEGCGRIFAGMIDWLERHRRVAKA
jgi:hypothetical protein